jgi:hypothetical protein
MLCALRFLFLRIRFPRVRMISAFGNLPVPDPRRASLTLAASPVVNIRTVCSINVTADGTFDLVCILSMIGPRHPTMTATLLAVTIEVTDLDGITNSILLFDRHIYVVHTDLLSQR